MGAESFPPAMRFHHGRDYGRVMHRQQKAAGKHVVVLVAPRRGTAQGPATTPRLGIMVSTKVADTAVRRHQLKRWVREQFRRGLHAQAGTNDVVILFRRDPPADFHAGLDAEIAALLTRAVAATSAPRPRQRR